VPQGSQVAFIQSNGEFSQSLSGFQANTNYVVTFFAAQRTNCCNPGGQQFAVYLDGTLLGTFNPPLNGVYVEYSTTVFTTTAGSHILKFVGLNPGGQAAFIDHVRLSGAPLIGNGVQWLVADHLGTPRMIVDESGNLSGVKRRDYLPFGEELLTENGRSTALGYSSADGVRQQFTQKERDIETGLDYSLARYYSPKQGRFTSIDPLIGSAKPMQPQGWNRYSYAINNPLKYVDPTGLIWGYYTDNTGAGHYHWYKDTDELTASGATEVTHSVANEDSPGFIYEIRGGSGWVRLNEYDNTWERYDSRGQALEGTHGSLGDQSTAINQAFDLALSDTGGRIVTSIGARLLGGVLARTSLNFASEGISVASRGGAEAAEMQLVRTINPGEKIADIVNEAKAFTFQSGICREVGAGMRLKPFS